MSIEPQGVWLDMQMALLGEVSSALRAVTIRAADDRVHFDAYFHGPIHEDDVESMSCVETELIAALPEYVQISHSLHRVDAPSSLPLADRCVYMRREE